MQVLILNNNRVIARAAVGDVSADSLTYAVISDTDIPEYPDAKPDAGQEYALEYDSAGVLTWALRSRPLTYTEQVSAAAAVLDDATALTCIALYSYWDETVTYIAGDRVQYGGVLYKCLQDHAAQADWTPDASPSLWARVLIPNPDIVPEWVQPDSTNPYMTGDKVMHGGKTWMCNTDNNVWEPGVYGWTEVTA